MKQFVGNLLRSSTRFRVGAWAHDLQFRLRTSHSVKKGHYHENDFVFFMRYAGKRAIFVDIGANIGQSIVSFKTAASDCIIYSFEPNPRAFGFATAMARKFSDVYVSQLALSAEKSTLTLHVPRYGRMRFYQLASTLDRDRDELAEWLRGLGFTYLKPGTLGSETVEVAALPLDAFNLSPDVIKIDVEGAETSVLRGGLETIKMHKPILLIENGDRNDICKLLKPLGYQPYFFDVNSQTLKKGGGSQNTFFLV
jgi:FkbM family methyltransferase